MKIAKLSDGRLCELLYHDVPVRFHPHPGWSLVAHPIGDRPHRQAMWWVKAKQITWVLDVPDEGE
jgi:hypothetical protein